MKNERYIWIATDGEYNANDWWDAVRVKYPELFRTLLNHGTALIREDDWAVLAKLPDFNNGPHYARNPIVNMGHRDAGYTSIATFTNLH